MIYFALSILIVSALSRDDNNDRPRPDDTTEGSVDRECDSTTYSWSSYCDECRAKTCTKTTNKDGRSKYDFAVIAVDASFCSEDNDCDGLDTDTDTDTTDDPCSGTLDEDSKCYKDCRDGNVKTTCTSTGDLYGDADRLDDLSDLCVSRNSELIDCPKYFIQAPSDDDSRVCPSCIEDCGEYGDDYDETLESYVRYYKKRESKGSDATICKRKRCQLIDVEVDDSVDGNITYLNVRREVFDDGEVEASFCMPTVIDDDDDSADETNSTAICAEACGDDEDELCVYDKESAEYMTSCKRFIACSKEDSSTKDRYSLHAYTRCEEPSNDECSFDADATKCEWKVKDSFSATSRCPTMCKCVRNPRGDSYGNVFICDGIDKMYTTLREKCAERLADADCSLDRLWFNQCPSKDDDDICEKLYCDTEQDPNDPDNGGVCRRSAERFADAKPTKRDESVGCFYKECVDDLLVSRRYDNDTEESEGIRRACPKLNDCTSVSYETNGICGACPVCDDEDEGIENEIKCKRNTLRRGDAACLEDDEAENDETRDEDKRDIAGRVRVKLAARFCADEFLGYTKDEIYAFIRESMVGILEGNCSDISTDDLRAYVSYFNYDVVDKDDSEVCDTVIKVQFRVDLCDRAEDRLQEILGCLEEMNDGEGTIQERVARVLAEKTSDTLFDADSVDTTTGATVYASPSAATVELTQADGSEWQVVAQSTPAPNDDGGDTTAAPEDNSGAARYFVIYGMVVASLAAVLF